MKPQVAFSLALPQLHLHVCERTGNVGLRNAMCSCV